MAKLTAFLKKYKYNRIITEKFNLSKTNFFRTFFEKIRFFY